MPKYWQTIQFKKLEKEWDLTLKEAGFIDAERTVGDERVLSQNAPNAYRQTNKVIIESKVEYFTLLTKHAGDEKFEDKIDELVMNLRANGYKIREICENLKQIGQKCHRQTVRFIIRGYEHKWGIRKWTQAKLDPPWRHYKKVPIK